MEGLAVTAFTSWVQNGTRGYLSSSFVGKPILAVASQLSFKALKEDKVFTEIFSQAGVYDQ